MSRNFTVSLQPEWEPMVLKQTRQDAWSSRSSAIGVGGFVGKNTARITIEDSHTSGKITGTSSLGGFVGETDNIIITQSFNSANIETTNKYAGGLAGYASANFLCEIYRNATIQDRFHKRISLGPDSRSRQASRIDDASVRPH